MVGGDAIDVAFTLQSNANVNYYGQIDDHGDGTYLHGALHDPVYTVALSMTTSEGVVDSLATCIGASEPFRKLNL